jgi:NAD(P) transhydrogenase subunit beta
MKGGIEFVYALAALLFVFGLKMLSSPRTARRGNFVSAAGMLFAVVGRCCTATSSASSG